MHLRRALLLFAIVLGMAALATAVSQPDGSRDEETAPVAPPPKRPQAGPGPGSLAVAPIEFKVGERPEAERLETGRAAVITVDVPVPGQVELEGLGGAVQAAEPVTPARFEVLAARPGRHSVVFSPATGDEPRVVGTLVVRAPQAATGSRSDSSDRSAAASPSSPKER